MLSGGWGDDGGGDGCGVLSNQPQATQEGNNGALLLFKKNNSPNSKAL